MSEIVGELGVREPNCAGISSGVFLKELADENLADADNNAKLICNHCEGRPECKIALGEVSIRDILLQEGN
jgi:hypothetical protein